MSCILHHRGVQLILAFSWTRPAILVAGKDRGGNVFISSLSFLFLFLPCPSLSSLLPSLLSIFSLFLGNDTKWPTRVDVSLNPNTINLSEGCGVGCQTMLRRFKIRKYISSPKQHCWGLWKVIISLRILYTVLNLKNNNKKTSKYSIEDDQEKAQSQIIAYQWHQEEEQTNQDRQYTNSEYRNERPRKHST